MMSTASTAASHGRAAPTPSYTHTYLHAQTCMHAYACIHTHAYSLGDEIDSADAVFRANAAQHYGLPDVGVLMHKALRSRKYWKFLFLLKMRLGGAGRDGTPRGGRRTDYRVACLFGDEVVSPNETCIVPRAWFDQREERARNSNSRAHA